MLKRHLQEHSMKTSSMQIIDEGKKHRGDVHTMLCSLTFFFSSLFLNLRSQQEVTGHLPVEILAAASEFQLASLLLLKFCFLATLN